MTSKEDSVLAGMGCQVLPYGFLALYALGHEEHVQTNHDHVGPLPLPNQIMTSA